MKQDRKRFLKKLGNGLLLASLPEIAFGNKIEMTKPDDVDFNGVGAADDEKFWKRIAKKYYDIDGDYINLENGYYGAQPKPVLQAFQRNIELSNKQNSKFARKDFPGIARSVNKEVADFLGVSEEEIVITRNATEALNIIIQGYPFKKGDEVILNQLDYFSMIETFRMLEKRGELKVNAFDMPLLPASEEEIVEIYQKQITANTRVILLTHVSNITGLIMPVAKIAAMARQKGIDIITDSAHALGQIDFSLSQLGSDFIGLNLHKWIGNPIGAGVMYIKKKRIAAMKSLFGDVTAKEDTIQKLSHFGTTPFSVIMTIPDSIAFHKKIGINRITARLHYLKTTWIKALQEQSNVEIVTPVAANLSCAIASFRIRNKTANEVADYLYNEHKIFTVGRILGKQGCVRVTPSVYNSKDDVNKLAAAVTLFSGM